jgi:Mn2+/Fe2+ NRAMP family transporter
MTKSSQRKLVTIVFISISCVLLVLLFFFRVTGPIVYILGIIGAINILIYLFVSKKIKEDVTIHPLTPSRGKSGREDV